VVVVEGVLSLIFLIVASSGVNINIGALRTIRVLRPLKTISFIPEMRLAIQTIFASVPDSGSLLMLIFISLTIFSSFGFYFYQGLFSYRCVEDLTGEFEETSVCGSFYTCGSEANITCSDIGINPNRDVTSFDDFRASIRTTFQIVTLEDWQQITWWTVDATGQGAFMFYLILILFELPAPQFLPCHHDLKTRGGGGKDRKGVYIR